MDKKPYHKLLQYISDYFVDLENISENSNLNNIFEDTIFGGQYIDFDDFISYHFPSLNYDYTKSLYQQYYNVDDSLRISVIEVLYNVVAYADLNDMFKQKISAFLIRYKLMLSDGDEYRSLISTELLRGEEGSFAMIYFLSEDMVKKQLKMGYWSDHDICSRFKYEYNIQKTLKECGVKVFDVYDYDEMNHSYLMDRADCDLDDFLRDNIVTDEQKVQLAQQIMHTMKLAHDERIIHRDLHLGNILLKGTDVFVTDFGFAKSEKILRSKLSTISPKPTHMFVAPEGLKDFTLLDETSDIYSIGKIIDYVFGSGRFGTSHPFKILVEKCCRSNKAERYQSMSELIKDFNDLLDDEMSVDKLREINSSIKEGIYNAVNEKYIVDLAKEGELSKHVVSNRWDKLGVIILACDSINSVVILKSLLDNYQESTGYGGWQNYDLFADIAYDVLSGSTDIKTMKCAYNLLEECAQIRFYANNLLNSVSRDIVMRVHKSEFPNY